MKNIISIFAVAALMISMNGFAQEPKQKAKKQKTNTEKSCATTEKKSCGSAAKAKGSCSAKKAVDKK
jgi:hypothetical protein